MDQNGFPDWDRNTRMPAPPPPAGAANVRCERADAEEIPSPDASFDVALCVLGLMYPAEPQKAVEQMARVLRPGGVIGLLWNPRILPFLYLVRLLLMMVGICLAANEPVQLENHLRGSLMQGATPREVLEVILNSTAIVGMPTTIMTRRMLEKVLEEDGRGGELDLVK